MWRSWPAAASTTAATRSPATTASTPVSYTHLLLLALVPGLWGWLCNWLTALSLNGPAFLFTLAFYIQVPAAIVFCLWLGHLCGRSERSYPACLLLTQWPSLVSFALYVWQFHFVSSEARSFLLAGLGQYPGLPLFSLACRLVIPFSNHSWGPPETLAANALSLLMLAVLFSLGFLWGRRRR